MYNIIIDMSTKMMQLLEHSYSKLWPIDLHVHVHVPYSIE